MSENLDSTDFRILDSLQQDASLTNVELHRHCRG
jgi:DNA-binding Lrp family transcriptional regulator